VAEEVTMAMFERVHVDPLAPLSVSRIRERISCVWRWDLKYRQGIVPATKAEPLSVGILSHKALETLLLTNSTKEAQAAIDVAVTEEIARLQILAEAVEEADSAQFADAVEEVESAGALAVELATRAYLWFDDNGWQPVTLYSGEGEPFPLVEYDFTADIGGVKVRMIPDFVMRHQDGRVIVWDVKFRKSSGSFATPETEDTDIQLLLYQVGLASIGIETHGVAVLSVLAHEEREVTLTKKGVPSRDYGKQWVTAENYEQALADRGLAGDPEFEDILTKLRARRWVEPLIIPRSEEDFLQVWQKVIMPLVEDNDPYPHRAFGSFGCRFCWARELCLADLRNESRDHLIIEVDQSVEEREENAETDEDIFGTA
jgi:hypothetical protein